MLDRLKNMAQRAANNSGTAYAVFNLNRVGTPMLVVREADSFNGENRMVAGPFNPQKPDDEA